MSNKIKTYSCPVVKLPDRQSVSVNGKVKRHDWDDNRSQSFATSKKAKTQSAAAEMKDIFESIKELSSTTLQGSDRKKYKEDKLTKLGAPPVKEQTMPFKMKMGILRGRKKREERALAQAKESGVVLAKTSKKDKKKRIDDENDDSGGPDWNLATHNGVLRISKNKFG